MSQFFHSLGEDGVPSRFTDYQIRPLHHHDGDEEGCVAGVLEDLPVIVGPLLAVAVLKIVDGDAVQLLPQAQKFVGPEFILTHDHQIEEEACRCHPMGSKSKIPWDKIH